MLSLPALRSLEGSKQAKDIRVEGQETSSLYAEDGVFPEIRSLIWMK
jgi:hypothetical protein